jgi:inorganic pyrophosphatase
MTVPKWQAHPWHGLACGDDPPALVAAFIEIVPSDTVKYELDKASGLLKIDRPLGYSSLSPEPYGFIPRTLSGAGVAALAAAAMGDAPGAAPALAGDDDPLDICVITEHTLSHAGVVVRARPIGGLRLVDGGAVDDKIVAVLHGDPMMETWRDLDDCPRPLVDRLEHYFLTYKDMPGTPRRNVGFAGRYGRAVAHDVIRAAMDDYRSRYGEG